MSIKLGDVVPNFTAETSQGPIDFHQWLGGSWAVLFSHPANYTPVCTTELGTVARIYGEFEKRKIKVCALSCNDVESHNGWIKDIQASQKISTFPYPIIADPKREIAITFGMLDPVEKDKAGLPLTCRAVFVIGPEKKLKLSFLYPATTGRNFDEVLRVIDSLQLTANFSVATPADWKQGGSCMIVPSVSNEDAKTKFPKGWETTAVPSGKEYLRVTPQPDV